MKLIQVILISVIVFSANFLQAQDELEAIVTWEIDEEFQFKCYNHDRGGSDLNNDGYDDFIHWYPESPYRFQFFMGAANLNQTCDFEIEVPFESFRISWGGDLNGDGYKDIVFKAHNYPITYRNIYICLGGEELDLEPELIIHCDDYIPDAYNMNYLGYNGGYDFNGDGYDDLLTMGYGPDYFFSGLIQIFPGGEELSNQPNFQIQGDICEYFGYYWIVGDINGDGFDDLIATRSQEVEYLTFSLELYLGGEYMDTVCDYELFESDWFGEMMNLATADFNGDGIEELFVLNIPPNGIAGSYYIDSSGELIFEQHFFEQIDYIQIADINGDDYDDIVSWNTELDLINVYYGGPDYDNEIDISLSVPDINYYDSQINFFCNVGDINGDGQDEILINNGEGVGPYGPMIGNSATIYGLPGSNAQEECKIKNVKCKISNYPNPFNPETIISFTLPENVKNPVIEIFNIKGALVRSFKIHNSKFKINSVVWDGTDNYRNQVSSGVYLYRLVADGRVLTSQKMILMK